MKTLNRHRWLGVGLTYGALLASCIESEEDLIADTVETSFITDAGETGAESTGGDTSSAVDDDDLPTLSAERAELPPFVPFEAIVKFRDSTAPSRRAKLVGRAQLEGITADTSLVRFEVGEGARRSPQDEIAATWARIDELRAREDVEFAHPNWLVKPSLVPNDAHYSKQWHYPQINLPAAWDLTTGSSTVRIAILDSGRTGHSDLYGKWLSGVEYDAYAEDGDATSSSSWNHAVAVASVAGGSTNNSGNSAGVCWGCKLLNVNIRSGGGSDIATVVRGLYWAVDNGARVINMSFETARPCSEQGDLVEGIPALKQAAEHAAIKNVTLVAAAGNGGVDAKSTSPASCPGVIAVAATDKNKVLAEYSNYGAVTIAAPGGAASRVPDPKIPGAYVMGPDGYGKEIDAIACGVDPASSFGTSTQGVVANWTTSTGKHCDRYLSGTSLAAPHVAGVVGLMLSRNPSLTPTQIRQILQDTAQPACGGKCGAGLLDALAAVKKAAPLPMNDPKPTATFTVQCAGLQCTFNGGGSTDNTGIVAYEWILPGQQFRLGPVVNAFMPGYGSQYVQLRVTDGNGQSTWTSKHFTISQPTVNPIAGQYHNPARPDNRIDLYETSDDGLALTWYTFNKKGDSIWYTSGAAQRIGARWSQPLYLSGWKNGVATPPIVVGHVWLDFSSSSVVWFSWVLDGVPGGERFTRLFGGEGRSGAWFMPTQSGWGISVEESGQELEANLGFFTGLGPTWARSKRVLPSSNLSLPMTVYRGKGLCPSCGGKSPAVPNILFGGSMKLQIADGSATSGFASTSIIYNALSVWTRPLQTIQLLTKP